MDSRRDDGFTLVELLVVMIIIGILAGIAVPVFLNQRAKARDAGARADLARIGKETIGWYVDNTSAPVITLSGPTWQVAGESVGSATAGVRIVSTFTGTAVNPAAVTTVPTTGWTSVAWCFALTSDNGKEKTFRFSAQAGLESGQCASATSPV